jgi:hypothetical protein
LQGFEQAAGRAPRRDEERTTAEIRESIRIDLISAEDVGARDGMTAREMDDQRK